MARKSGLGREDDFDFNKSKPKQPPKLSEKRPGDRTSFYLRPDPTLFPKDPCDSVHISNDLPNLNILGKGGRQFGDLVLYDPIQKKNYLSQSDRYERSLNILPANVIERDGKTIYLFCSSTSPTGFWEVTVGGAGTYLRFTPPILTIICPRPLALKDLTVVETDGTSIKWTQTQGRLTIVSPSSGEGSLNPDIFIIGNRSPLDPPILLEAELEDNPSFFDILVIRTTIAEEFDGVSGMEAITIDGGPLFTIPCLFSPLPNAPNTAYCWDSGSIEITWNSPPYSQWLVEYRVQQNIGGVYQTIATIPTNNERRATVFQGNYYRILAVFNSLNAGYSATESCRIYFSPNPPYYVLSSDRIDGLSGSDGQLTATQYSLTAITCETSIDRIDSLSGSDGQLTATQYPLLPITCETSIDRIDSLSGNEGQLTATIYNLTGGIVG
jgi:hypothetical protein